MQAVSLRVHSARDARLEAGAAAIALRPLQALMMAPVALFLLALMAMLLRHPDVSFYEIDRVAFGLLALSVVGRAVVLRQPLFHIERASWPMLGLTLLAIASVAGQPFDHETWSLLAAKFIVPFALFHLAGMAFTEENSLRQFEVFVLMVLAYLSFTSIAFLLDAKGLIFPQFILDESLGYHADRARGPLLQAVANGVSLNLLGLLALQAFCRQRMRGLKALLLLASIPVAILATMTRAVWLTFSGTVIALIMRSPNRSLRRASIGLLLIGTVGLLLVLGSSDSRKAIAERFEERGPVEFRTAVYTGGWQMFLERPLTGWGVNQMPSELARHVSGYKHSVLYPHNTYLELLVEHGIAGLGLYLWLMWEIWRLGRGPVPRAERNGFLDQQFHRMWPMLLAVYWVNAALVVMNYQFVNGLLFTMAGMLAAQGRRAYAETQTSSRSMLDSAGGLVW
jgi:putative inorganic carbon (hco3(-)) transporter